MDLTGCQCAPPSSVRANPKAPFDAHQCATSRMPIPNEFACRMLGADRPPPFCTYTASKKSSEFDDAAAFEPAIRGTAFTPSGAPRDEPSTPSVITAPTEPHPRCGGGNSSRRQVWPASTVAYTIAWAPGVVWPIQPVLASSKYSQLFTPSSPSPFIVGCLGSVASMSSHVRPPFTVRAITTSCRGVPAGGGGLFSLKLRGISAQPWLESANEISASAV